MLYVCILLLKLVTYSKKFMNVTFSHRQQSTWQDRIDAFLRCNMKDSNEVLIDFVAKDLLNRALADGLDWNDWCGQTTDYRYSINFKTVLLTYKMDHSKYQRIRKLALQSFATDEQTDLALSTYIARQVEEKILEQASTVKDYGIPKLFLAQNKNKSSYWIIEIKEPSLFSRFVGFFL